MLCRKEWGASAFFEKSARLLVESPTTKALNLDVFVSMTFAENE
jgi:hypothetical protein